MKFYTHCGNFETVLEALDQSVLLKKKFPKSKVCIRKRQTSIDKEKEPYEVVMVEDEI